MNETLAILHRLAADDGYPARLATLVRVEGSSYRRPGARLLLDPAGQRLGSISGGCLEADLVARMRPLAAGRPFEIVVYDTTSENDLVWGVGTGCHGVVHIALEFLPSRPPWAAHALERLRQRQPVDLIVQRTETGGGTTLPDAGDPSTDPATLFRQTLQPPHHLVIFGAGEDARPLVRLAKVLGWTVTVADARPEFARSERFAGADAVVCADPEQAARLVSWDRLTAVVLMTHHYRFDLPLLGALLPLELPYVGLLGPRRRADRLLEEVERARAPLSTPARQSLHAPVGLDLGGDGPEAVALAILAEIQAHFARRDARPLRHRQNGIHDV